MLLRACPDRVGIGTITARARGPGARSGMPRSARIPHPNWRLFWQMPEPSGGVHSRWKACSINWPDDMGVARITATPKTVTYVIVSLT